MKRFFSNRFVRNAAALQVGAALNGIGGLASVFLLANLLGSELQGEYFTAVAMYAGLGLLVNIGILQGTVNQVAGAVARGLDKKVTEWLAFLVKSYVLLGLLLPVVGWFVLPVLGDWIQTLSGADFATGADGRSPTELAWYLTFTPLLEVPRQMVTAALQGTRRMKFLAQVENGQEVVRVFAVTVGALLTFSPTGPVVGLLCGSAFGSVIGLAIYSKARHDGGYTLPSLREVAATFLPAPLFRGLPLCLRIGALRNLDAFGFNVFPQLVVRSFASPEWVTYFWVAHRIMSVPLMLMQGISRTALPALSELRGMKDMDQFRRQWLRVTLAGGGIISAGLLIGLPLVPFIVAAAFPADYHDPIPLLTKILVIGFIPNAFCTALDSFFIITGKIKVLLVNGLTGLPVYAGACVLLSQVDPTTGAAWGYTIARSWPALCFFYIAYYFKKHRGEKLIREEVEAADAAAGTEGPAVAGAPRAEEATP